MKETFRKAGRKLMEFDNAYSKKIADMYIQDGKRYSRAESNVRGLGAGLLGGIPISEKYSRAEDRAPDAVIGLNAAVRYGAPIAGLTLAGKGIYDMSINNGQGEQSPGTIMP